MLTPLLLVVATFVTAGAILAGWAQWQLLDTGSWRATSGKLLERKEIRDRLAVYVAGQVRGAAGTALPPVIDAGLRRAVARGLETASARRSWRAATAEAHRELVHLIEDDERVRGDVVTLDLRPVIRAVAREDGIPLPALPETLGQVDVVAGDQVRGAREAADRLHRVAIVLLVVAPLRLLLAVVLARGWRARAIAGAGVSVAASGALVLLARALVGAHVVDVLAPAPTDHDAVAAAWSVSTSQLAFAAGAAIVAGLLVALVATVAGRAQPRSRYL